MRKLWACLVGSALLLAALGYSILAFLLSTSRDRQRALEAGEEAGIIAEDPYLLYLSTNATLPPVGGAIRHYQSLLDDDEPVTLRCSSCAIVSSSGSLLGQGAGPDIDRHACVVRMNMAPVEGYQGDVGRRTTLRVMNFFLVGLRGPDDLPPASRVMVWGLMRRASYLAKARALAGRLRASGAGWTLHGQTAEGEREASSLFAKETGQPLGGTKSWLSTGWFTLMIAIDICQEIHVYGMVTSDYCIRSRQRDHPYHYYRSGYFKSKGSECSTYLGAERNRAGGHRFMTEKAVFARWALRHNISFHRPEWRVDREAALAKLDTPFLHTVGRRNL